MINPPDALPHRSWLGWFASLLLAGQLIDTPHALAVVSEDLLPQQAEWITVADQHYPAGSAGVSFTRTFQVSLAPVKAILLAASDGTARIEINGTFVGVTTGVSNATTLDVTRHLTTGTNLLKVEVVQTPKPPALRVMLELALPDGRQRWVVSDASWKTTRNSLAGNPSGRVDVPTTAMGPAGVTRFGNPFSATKSVDAYNSWMLAQGAMQATDPASIEAPKGFVVELLRSAAAGEDSWIAMDFDPAGRLAISMEKRGILRFTLGSNRVDRVEKVEDSLLECRGLLHAHGYLFVNANNSRGLYRLRDADGDGFYEEKKLLLSTEGGVGHGRNQLALGPDGLIYIAHGDDVRLPPNLAPDSPLRRMPDDLLRPSARPDKPAPVETQARVGHVLQTDAEGSFFRLHSGGLRNPMDIAFGPQGELFTYDADMERDITAPWYQPTRVLHLIAGGDYGWRRSEPNIPDYAPDVLPSVVDVGVGSPTGIAFGTHSRFPSPWRESLFIADWSYGRLLAVTLTPDKASFSGRWQPFLSGRPLNITDLTFGPDGWLYFITGGRGTQSGLYRLQYSPGSPRHTAAAAPPPTPEMQMLRRLSQPGAKLPEDEQEAARLLGHPDRWVRYAARTLLEQSATHPSYDLAWKRSDAAGLNTVLAAVRTQPGAVLQALDRLAALPLPGSESDAFMVLLRATGSALMRTNPGPMHPALLSLASTLDTRFPARNRLANHELSRILCFLRHTNALEKTSQLMASAQIPGDLVHYANVASQIRDGWTLKQAERALEGLQRAEIAQGGRDYYGAIRRIRNQILANVGAQWLPELKPYVESRRPAPQIIPPMSAPGISTRSTPWKMEDFDLGFQSGSRNSLMGKAAFSQAGCIHCHRQGGEGGDLGPDLSQLGRRMDRRAILESIIHPSKVIDEKYQLTNLTLRDDTELSGLVIREDSRSLRFAAGTWGDMESDVAVADIARRQLSEISPMPEGLLDGLGREQILDLLSFLETVPAAQ